ARALVVRGAKTDNVVFAAAAGRVDEVRAFCDGKTSGRPPTGFPLAEDHAVALEQALVFSCMCGQNATISLLLDRGVNVNAVPPGSHWTSTALHTAAAQGHLATVKLLLDRGAGPHPIDARYRSTRLGWAEHFHHDEVAALPRARTQVPPTGKT